MVYATFTAFRCGTGLTRVRHPVYYQRYDHVKYLLMPGEFARLGAVIATIRKAHGLRQREFAEALGVSLVAVQMWEQGLKRPGIDNILKLADLAPPDLVWEVLKEIGLRPERARAWLPHAPKLAIPTPVAAPDIRLITAEQWRKFLRAGEEEKAYDVLPLFREGATVDPAREPEETEIEGWTIIHHSMNRGHRTQAIVCVRVKGHSMDPVMPDGSIAAVDISRRAVIWREPKPALVKFEDVVTVKLVRALPRGRLELSAYNSDAWPVRECAISEAEIRGHVIWWLGRLRTKY